MIIHMSVEQNKAIVSKFFEELWNNRNFDLADELFATDCVTHQLRSGNEVVSLPRGPEVVKRHVAEWLTAFPDLSFAVEQTIADADRVVSRAVMQGTHTGSWNGIAPTGKLVSIRMIVIQRIAKGKIAEDWVLVEALGLLQQLELVEPTEEIFARGAR